MFKKYDSKPVTRLAHKITEHDTIIKVMEKDATFQLKALDRVVTFKAREPIKTGDYIVYHNCNYLYHCNAKVFAERNIIPPQDSSS